MTGEEFPHIYGPLNVDAVIATTMLERRTSADFSRVHDHGMAVSLASSRTYPCPPTHAFEVLLSLPLPELFRHWYGPLPPIRTTDETGVWGSVGQRRHIDLVGPGSMEETLTEVVPPHHFAYRLSGIRGPMAALIASVDGRWELEPAGTGVRVTWRWEVTPTALGRHLMPVFGRLWQGYAARALEVVETHLVTS